jgi:hypothetical protein
VSDCTAGALEATRMQKRRLRRRFSTSLVIEGPDQGAGQGLGSVVV